MLRRTAVLSALLLALTGCGGEQPEPTADPTTPTPSATPTTTSSPTATATPTPSATPSATPTPTAVPPTPKPTPGGALQGAGGADACRPEPGPVLLQRPLEVTRSMLVEDIGVYPGGLPVQGAWVARTPDGVPDLVSTVDWPDGFGADARRRYGWADRTEAIQQQLAPGRYHLFLVLDLGAGDTLDGLDVVWTDGHDSGQLALPGRVRVGGCR